MGLTRVTLVYRFSIVLLSLGDVESAILIAMKKHGQVVRVVDCENVFKLDSNLSVCYYLIVLQALLFYFGEFGFISPETKAETI